MTHEEVSKLTDEEIRIKVAELCGWSHDDRSDGVTMWWHDEINKTLPPEDDGFRDCPNYPQDLNACHEFEVAMPDEQAFLYGHNLMAILTRDKSRALISATARQRCEAFLLTMTKGKQDGSMGSGSDTQTRE